MCRMWKFISSTWKLETAHAHPQWGEATQVPTMRLCIFTHWRSKSSHQNTFLTKAKSMQILRLFRSHKITSYQALLIHSGEKTHYCNECGSSFNQAGTLNDHLRVHTGEKPYKCPQCSYASSHTGALRVHIKTHSLQKPNQCKFCDFSAITKSHLTRHLPILLLHTGEKTHFCIECGSSFNQAGTLKDHLRVHTGEKPYTCQ